MVGFFQRLYILSSRLDRFYCLFERLMLYSFLFRHSAKNIVNFLHWSSGETIAPEIGRTKTNKKKEKSNTLPLFPHLVYSRRNLGIVKSQECSSSLDRQSRLEGLNSVENETGRITSLNTLFCFSISEYVQLLLLPVVLLQVTIRVRMRMQERYKTRRVSRVR